MTTEATARVLAWRAAAHGAGAAGLVLLLSVAPAGAQDRDDESIPIFNPGVLAGAVMLEPVEPEALSQAFTPLGPPETRQAVAGPAGATGRLLVRYPAPGPDGGNLIAYSIFVSPAEARRAFEALAMFREQSGANLAAAVWRERYFTESGMEVVIGCIDYHLVVQPPPLALVCALSASEFQTIVEAAIAEPAQDREQSEDFFDQTLEAVTAATDSLNVAMSFLLYDGLARAAQPREIVTVEPPQSQSRGERAEPRTDPLTGEPLDPDGTPVRDETLMEEPSGRGGAVGFDPDRDDTTSAADGLVGTWLLPGFGVLEFRGDGTYAFHNPVQGHAGTYRANGESWSLESETMPYEDGGTYRLHDPDTLELVGKLGGAVWQRVKP